MDNELNVKEVAFNKVTQWLKDYGFKIKTETRNKTGGSEIQFQANVYPANQERLFFMIVFSNRFKNSFNTGSTISLPEEVSKTIDTGMIRKEQEQVYIDIYRLVFSQGLDCDTRFPMIDIHKLIFIDTLKDKQYFFDSVFNLIHAMILVEGRFDELINRFFPKE